MEEAAERNRKAMHLFTKIMPEWKKVYDNLFLKNFEELKQIDRDLDKYVE